MPAPLDASSTPIAPGDPDRPIDVLHAQWDFSDPKASMGRFVALLDHPPFDRDPDLRAEALSQVARALGLQRRFTDAQAVLAQAEQLIRRSDTRPRVRILLERGRLANTTSDPDRGRDAFARAWELAVRLGEEALAQFRIALAEREAQGRLDAVLIARWCVARCTRALGDVDAALAQQRALLEAHQRAGTADGFVHEERAECLLARGQPDAAAPHFAMAHALLGADPLLASREPDRLARLAELGRRS